MSAFNIEIDQSRTVKFAVDIAKKKGVKIRTSSDQPIEGVIVSATTHVVLGFTIDAVDASEDAYGTVLQKGIMLIESGGAGVTAGEAVSCDANGDVVDAGANTQCVGMALTTATDGNDAVIVVDCPSKWNEA